MMRVVVERVAPQHAGLVGGMFNSILQVSAAIGIAVLGGLFYAALGSRSDSAAVTHAFSVTLLAIAGCHAGGALLAAGLGQRRPATLPMPSPTACPEIGR
jgi:predicted MFS family arabinose efflux permease